MGVTAWHGLVSDNTYQQKMQWMIEKRIREINFESIDGESGKWAMQSPDMYSLLWCRDAYQASLWPKWNIS